LLSALAAPSHLVLIWQTARNVLVSSSSTAPHGLVAKLADLGLSRVIKMHKTHRTTNTVGTMSHMPPGKPDTAVTV